MTLTLPMSTCIHCGYEGPDGEDHTCPCPYSDLECPNHVPLALAFADPERPQAFVFDGPATFEVDRERRVIRGLGVPYNTVGRSRGRLFSFSQGTLKWSAVSRVKLWINHDPERAVGVAFELDDRPDGLYPAFKVARGPLGDMALQMAEDGVWDGLSIGVPDGGKYALRDGVYHSVDVPLGEISLTPAPSFADARVHQVAASADMRGNQQMPCSTCGQHHAEGVACPTSAAPPAGTPSGPGSADFSAITDAIRAGFDNLANPQGVPGVGTIDPSAPVGQGAPVYGLAGPLPPRAVVPAGHGFAVTEELPYRFDGIGGAHGFISDLRDSAMGAPEARQRLETFMGEAFAVTGANAAALTPVQNRPELYVPNLSYTRPLWELCSTGVVTDKTSFTVPKFASASGLVGAHTEGVEPTPGAFAASSQQINPAPVSGKIQIVREVWDMGGSPQADGIIWGEMLNGYYEALESKIATLLNGLTLTETNLASAVDLALVNLITGMLADLQFVRGGNRFTSFASDGLLFKALIQAKDTAGRTLLPVLGVVNGQGTTSGAFDRVAVGNLEARAAWALGAANSSNSYLFVPSSVWAWASPPQRFTFEYQVATVDMAVWGYSATASLRDSDVKRIDYTTADV